jgi:CubicO group peptidase (beta-lactamase class C family)
LKILLYVFLLANILQGCNLSSAKTDKGKAEDSLQYYPPTPGKLGRQEFRQYFRTLDRFFDSMLIRRGFNGSILVAKEGEVLYEKYEGYRDLRLKDQLTDTTSFHLASTSKPFTAMAILRLVQENKLTTDDSLSHFFPGLPYPGITVKMLLNHRSGLPNYVNFMGDAKKWDTRITVTNEMMLDFLYTKKPQRDFAPDTRFTYSNTNYVLLAMIIEKVSGRPFADYMKTYLFDPLRMKHTYVCTLDKDSLATRSFKANGAIWDNDHLEGTYGDKNIYSTARDMLKWDQALYSGVFIRQSLLDSAFTPYSFERPGIHNYGLGWRMLLIPNGKKVIYHFGRWHGFTPAFARLTDEKVTIIILGNKFNRNIYNAAHLAYDLFGNYQQQRNDDKEETDTPEPVKRKSAVTRKSSGLKKQAVTPKKVGKKGR